MDRQPTLHILSMRSAERDISSSPAFATSMSKRQE